MNSDNTFIYGEIHGGQGGRGEDGRNTQFQQRWLEGDLLLKEVSSLLTLARQPNGLPALLLPPDKWGHLESFQ